MLSCTLSPYSLLYCNIYRIHRALNLPQLSCLLSFLTMSYLTFKGLLLSIKLSISEARDTPVLQSDVL